LKLIKRRRCWMGITRLASDHLPVIAEFELQTVGGSVASKADNGDQDESPAENINFLI